LVSLKTKEEATILFHMSIMRKSVKKGFKKTYGKEGKQHLKTFDDIHSTFKSQVEIDGLEQTEYYFDQEEIVLLLNFIDWYIPELEKSLKASGGVSEEDQQQITALMDIYNKLVQDKEEND